MKKRAALFAVVFAGGCAHQQAATEAPTPKKEAAAIIENHGAVPKAAQAATPGKPDLSRALVEKSVVKGESSRDDIVTKLGPPYSVVKHPYHVPKINAPGFKMNIPAEMLAVETWNYWKLLDPVDAASSPKGLLVKLHFDETGHVIDYEVSEKDLQMQQ